MDLQDVSYYNPCFTKDKGRYEVVIHTWNGEGISEDQYVGFECDGAFV